MASDTCDLEMTMEDYKNDLHHVISQMMFVSGETADPSVEATSLIEKIVHAQVVEMLKQGTSLASRRGSRSIKTEDLFFLIRHDKAKTSRLKTFLSWKDVRKSAKDSDDKGGDLADLGGGDDPLGGADGAPGGGGPMIGDTAKKNKRTKITLPWDVQSYFSEQVPERDDDEDEEEEEMNAATMLRLKTADERTKNMTKDEYVHYSECRQASFTFRKAKRFREWAEFHMHTDSKPNDDIVDILGFLTFEIVQTLTEEALQVKAGKEKEMKRTGVADTENKKRKRETGLFGEPEEGRSAVSVKDIEEAFRRLQNKPLRNKVWMGPPRAPRRTELRLI
ncbi:MAG: hypothetical protein LQ342_006268 [Letrouitia transgressa]|nr:MAG: hypothetical protein LQ342_006268 [Letrouitia transgressa]